MSEQTGMSLQDAIGTLRLRCQGDLVATAAAEIVIAAAMPSTGAGAFGERRSFGQCDLPERPPREVTY